MPKDNHKFQGLLDKEAPFMDISTEIPGVPLEEEEEEYQVVTDKPEPGFEELAATGLDNVGILGIDAEAWVHNAQAAMNAAKAAAVAAATWPNGPCLVKAFEDEIMYNIMFNLPDAGLMPPWDNPEPEEPATARMTSLSCRPLVGIPRNHAGVWWAISRMMHTHCGCNSSSWEKCKRTGVLLQHPRREKSTQQKQ